MTGIAMPHETKHVGEFLKDFMGDTKFAVDVIRMACQ